MKRIAPMQYLAAASLLTVFVINILTPPAIVIDVLYVCSIVLVFKQSAKTILCFSIAACVLISINTLFFDFNGIHSMSPWINRLISLFAIAVTSYTAIHYRRQTQLGAVKDRRYVATMKALLFTMSHQVRKPVANILGLTAIMQIDGADLSGDMQVLCAHLKSSAAELDIFITALNVSMEQYEKRDWLVKK